LFFHDSSPSSLRDLPRQFPTKLIHWSGIARAPTVHKRTDHFSPITDHFFPNLPPFHPSNLPFLDLDCVNYEYVQDIQTKKEPSNGPFMPSSEQICNAL
jgi:hypothetical protein